MVGTAIEAVASVGAGSVGHKTTTSLLLSDILINVIEQSFTNCTCQRKETSLKYPECMKLMSIILTYNNYGKESMFTLLE